MKTLMTSTALTAAIFAAGFAQAQSSMDQPMFPERGAETDIHASDLIGMTVYVAEPTQETAWDVDEVAGMQADWDNVGEINDLVVTRDGDIANVLVDIGGFLGMGERQVAMSMSELRFVSDSDTDDPNDFFLVIPASMADLEEAPEYQGFEMHGAMDSDINPAEPHGGMDGAMTAEEVATLTTEDLTGTAVYDANGEWIGEVSQLNLADDGTINAAIVDVGGFLGLGEKPVELSLDQLNITREDGDELRVSVPMTESELEALPTWEG